jgi:tetratricopeptide (TPR) repeat protein
LLSAVTREAVGLTRLWASGVESEYELAFSGLFQLLGPVLGLSEELPERPRVALEGVLGLGRPVAGGEFAAAVGTLLLLGETASQADGVLCVVEDAQWIDSASAKVLRFVARRIEAEPIGLLVAARTGEEHSFDPTGLGVVDLGPLSPEESAVVLTSGSRVIAPRVVKVLVAKSSGNPLALRVLPSLLSSDQLMGRSPLPDPLPVGDAVSQAFRRQLGRLDEAANQALLVAAASHDGDLGVVNRALELHGVPVTAFDEAQEGQLVELSFGKVRFRHPLIRSTVYQMASPAARREVHSALAAALGSDQTEARAWHQAEAATGPDDRVAADLEQAAATALQRGAPATAAAALAKAAEFRTDPTHTTRALIAAANAWWTAGRPDRAESVASRAALKAPSPELLLDLRHLQGRIAIWTGRPEEGIRLLTEAARTAPNSSRGRLSLSWSEAAMACMMIGDATRGIRSAHKAVELAAGQGSIIEVTARSILAAALVVTGSPTSARREAEAVRAMITEIDQSIGTPACFVAYTLMTLEEFDESQRVLNRIIGTAREQGTLSYLPFALALQSALCYRMGRYAAARAAAAESVGLAVATDQHSQLPLGKSSLACAESVLGYVEQARTLFAEVADDSRRHGIRAIETISIAGLGVLELSVGSLDAAVTALEYVRQVEQPQGIAEPAVVAAAPDLVEAYVRSRRRFDAETLLASFTEQAVRSASPIWATGSVSRCRGLLASVDRVDAEFDQARAIFEPSPYLLEQARTELCWGERLRRSGRRVDARPRLRLALELFEGAGAVIWADRARNELAATGERIRRSSGSATAQLTPRNSRSAWPWPAGQPTRKSPPPCSSARRPSSFTSATSTPNSVSAPARNWLTNPCSSAISDRASTRSDEVAFPSSDSREENAPRLRCSGDTDNGGTESAHQSTQPCRPVRPRRRSQRRLLHRSSRVPASSLQLPRWGLSPGRRLDQRSRPRAVHHRRECRRLLCG